MSTAPEDDEARAAPEDVAEDRSPILLDEHASTAAQQLVDADRRLAEPVADHTAGLERQYLRAKRLALDDLVEHRRFLAFGNCDQSLDQLGLVPVDEDVDLAAAGQADGQAELIRDPVARKSGRPPGERLPRQAIDLVFDAAARDGARELSAFRDAELRADGARRRAARRDNCREGDLLAAREPPAEVRRDFQHESIVPAASGLRTDPSPRAPAS